MRRLEGRLGRGRMGSEVGTEVGGVAFGVVVRSAPRHRCLETGEEERDRRWVGPGTEGIEVGEGGRISYGFTQVAVTVF